MSPLDMLADVVGPRNVLRDVNDIAPYAVDWRGTYRGQPAAVLRRRQICYAGPAGGVAAWLDGYVKAGASHLMLRFAGDHERLLDVVAKACALTGAR